MNDSRGWPERWLPTSELYTIQQLLFSFDLLLFLNLLHVFQIVFHLSLVELIEFHRFQSLIARLAHLRRACLVLNLHGCYLADWRLAKRRPIISSAWQSLVLLSSERQVWLKSAFSFFALSSLDNVSDLLFLLRMLSHSVVEVLYYHFLFSW